MRRRSSFLGGEPLPFPGRVLSRRSYFVESGFPLLNCRAALYFLALVFVFIVISPLLPAIVTWQCHEVGRGFCWVVATNAISAPVCVRRLERWRKLGAGGFARRRTRDGRDGLRPSPPRPPLFLLHIFASWARPENRFAARPFGGRRGDGERPLSPCLQQARLKWRRLTRKMGKRVVVVGAKWR